MIEELNKKDINQIMDIWLKENKRTHSYIPETYWDNHFEEVKEEILKGDADKDRRCPNPHCITNIETYLSPSFLSDGQATFCEYCDTPVE